MIADSVTAPFHPTRTWKLIPFASRKNTAVLCISDGFQHTEMIERGTSFFRCNSRCPGTAQLIGSYLYIMSVPPSPEVQTICRQLMSLNFVPPKKSCQNSIKLKQQLLVLRLLFASIWIHFECNQLFFHVLSGVLTVKFFELIIRLKDGTTG